MIFNSVVFAIFYTVVFYLYWLLFKNNIKLRNIFLTIVSYVFYGWWDWRFLSLIFISSILDYSLGKMMNETDEKAKRKKLLLVSIFVNIGFLGFFKYFNFFVDSFVSSMSMIGIEMTSTTLNIILPVGISFYTFQTLSYTLDIYHKKMKPTYDIFAFLAFVSFFPQLVAGPIERAKHLLPQYTEPKKFDYEKFRSGLIQMAIGFFKKIVIADRLAVFVDSAFDDVNNTHGSVAIFALIFFAFQLYLDFSAYSDIAIGCARTLGFNLSTNFRRPYLSSSFSNFWSRWHISLSSWFKDYVYIPLGGNKVNNFKVQRNVMIVFLVSGLWHGASWNFVIWGGLNGLFIILLDRFLIKGEKISSKLFNALIVSGMWALSLAFFRGTTFNDAITILSNIFSSTESSIYEFGLLEKEFKFTMILLSIFMIGEIIVERQENLYEWFISRHFIVRWISYVSIVAFTIIFGYYGISLRDGNFIYFQF